MIHFDFYVSDEEANTIFECITDEIYRMEEEKLDWIGARSNSVDTCEKIKATIQWFENRISYLQELKSKMKNTKVANEDC